MGGGIDCAAAETPLRNNLTDPPGEDPAHSDVTNDDTNEPKLDIDALMSGHLNELNRENTKLEIEVDRLRAEANIPQDQAVILLSNSLLHISLVLVWRLPLHYVLVFLALVFVLLGYNRAGWRDRR